MEVEQGFWAVRGCRRVRLHEGTGTPMGRSPLGEEVVVEEEEEEAAATMAGISATATMDPSDTAETTASAVATSITTTTAAEAAETTPRTDGGTRGTDPETRRETDVIEDTEERNSAGKKRTENVKISNVFNFGYITLLMLKQKSWLKSF